MNQYVQILKQQLRNLEAQLGKTNNPIEWIRLDAQCMAISDAIRIAEQIVQQAQPQGRPPMPPTEPEGEPGNNV